jgi:hypothetical protein
MFSQAAAKSPAAVSSDTLGSMGLGGMQTLSDEAGQGIRGKGTFAGVWGQSSANWSGGQSSSNAYKASASWVHKPASATGKSLSFAGTVQGTFAADPTGHALSISFCGGFAGGGAFAVAH